MTGIRPIIEHAVAAYIAEHPKHFSERGIEKAQAGITRKVMAALMRSDGDTETTTPEPPAEPQRLTADPKSREGRAYTNLRMLAGATPPFRMNEGAVSIPPTAQRESVYALADCPAQDTWKLRSGGQMAAWLEFFRETLPGIPKKDIQVERDGVTGILMPWPWPPSVDGKIYRDEAA